MKQDRQWKTTHHFIYFLEYYVHIGYWTKNSFYVTELSETFLFCFTETKEREKLDIYELFQVLVYTETKEPVKLDIYEIF